MRGPRLLAFLAGGLPALAFPEPALWWFAYVALVPLLLAVRAAPTAREAAVRGWLGGAGFILAVQHWLLPNLLVFLPVVAAVVGLLWLPWGWGAWYVLRPPVTARRAGAALVALPCGWVVIELVRSQAALGGPWGLMGATQWQVPPMRDLAALGGVWLVSLVVVAANLAVLLCATAPPPARLVPLGAGALLVAGSAGWTAARPEPEVAGAATVAVVQPGPTRGPGPRFERAAQMTQGLAARGVDLVVWGESSVGFDLDERPDLARRLAGLSEAVGAPLLVNVDARRRAGGIYKSSVLVEARGVVARYDKMRLVPFGEYVPLRPLFSWATKLRAAAEDRGRGERPVVMTTGPGLRLGPLVCFESSFPDMSRALAGKGADLLVFQSSTSTFQGSWAPEQHAALAALRAAETGRPAVHATLTGTSVVYDGRGRALAGPLSTQTSASLVVTVPLTTGRTPYVASGDAVPVLAVLAVGATLWFSAPGRRVTVDGRTSPTSRRRRDGHDTANST